MISKSIRRWIYTISLGGMATLAAQTTFAVDLPTTTLLPVTPGTPETRSQPFITWFGDLSRIGYVEEEYLISGDANIYDYTDNDAQSPEVAIRDSAIPYVSRILVRKPTRRGRFNGTVYVEILNPTAGWDGDAVWNMNHEYLTREGAVYVGLTSKPVALNFLRDSWGQPPLPVRNNSRYASLEMPLFGQIWDMLSELGALLKSDNPNNPLRGMDVERVIMGGYSQSAAYQVTYANSFHADATMPDGAPIYDGYYIAAGGDQAKNVNRPTPLEESLPEGDPRNLTNVDVPVIRFQTETEVLGFGSYVLRQTEPTYPLMRYYEMAGGSHADLGTNEVSGPALARDLGFPDFAAFCELPLNPIRISYVQSALLDALDRWIRGDQLPPPSRLITLTTNGGVPAIALDSDGNALGGVRPATLEVPLGNYLAFNTGGGFCFLFGGFVPFDDAEIRSRYHNHGEYVKQLTQEASRAVRERFLLQPDAQTLRRNAAGSAIGK